MHTHKSSCTSSEIRKRLSLCSFLLDLRQGEDFRFPMMKSALIVGIGFFACGVVGLLLASLISPHEFCFSSCPSRYEEILVKFAIRIYGLISMGVGSLFVVIGTFGNAVHA
jgi:hypothetical protein